MACSCICHTSISRSGRPAARSDACFCHWQPVARPLRSRAALTAQAPLAVESSQGTSGTKSTSKHPARLQQESARAAATTTQLFEDFQRQVPTLPQGLPALQHLLRHVDALLSLADACAGSSTGHAAQVESAAGAALLQIGRRRARVLQAYLQLALVDVVSSAWRQRARQIITRLHGHVAKGSKRALALERLLQQARSALCGCRYLRLHAAAALASAAHTAMDSQGHSPSLDLAALPGRSAIGLCFAQLLQEQLLYNGSPGNAPPAAATRATAAAAVPKYDLEWDQYLQCCTDPSLIGSFDFDYWTGRATFLPAPFPKGFSTRQLQAVLTPALVLGSLSEGSWGAALLAAARQAGLGQVADQISRRGPAAAAATSAAVRARAAAAAAAAADSAHSGATSAALTAAAQRAAAAATAAEKRQVALAGRV